MAKYRKKAVVVEAWKWDEKLEIINRMGDADIYYDLSDDTLTINTHKGEKVNKGDYIIKDSRGEYYPCKPDIFKETYEEVEDDS